MIQNSTQNLLLLHAYGETSDDQKRYLAKELAKDPALHEELVEMIQAKKLLAGELKSPSATSIRIIMEHSYKTEHLQEM
jgi:anti-sigma factor RsiW